MNKPRVILVALADGPATASEMAASLGMPRGYVSPTLSNMYRSRYVTRSVFNRHGCGPAPFLYAISELGMRKIKEAA